MWNFTFEIPCLLMMVTLLAFYVSRPRLSIRLNRTFVMLLVLQALVMVSDYASTKADENYLNHSVATLYALNTAYFVFFLLRIYGLFRITLDIACTRRQEDRPLFVRHAGVACALVVAISLSSPLTGAFFSIGPDGYQSGPAYGLLYLCFVWYIGMALVLVFLRMRYVRPHEAVGLVAYNLVLLIGIAVRYAFPRMLVMNTFCTIAILVVYLSFLNPDLYLTDRGPAFNTRGLMASLAEQSRRGNYCVLGFAIKNYNHERGMVGGTPMDQAITAINEWLLEAYPQLERFYLRSGRFALVGSSHLDWEEVRAGITARFARSWQTAGPELSLGVGFAFVGSEASHESLDRVSSALIIALENARDPDVVGDADDTMGVHGLQQVNEQVTVLRHLEQAIERHEVEIYLQPLLDSRTRRMVAAEALARIRDDEGNVIPPGMFIPLAERSGLINPLGDQVFEKTCAFIASHDMEAMGLDWINVNLSPLQCLQRDLVERLAGILERYNVSPERIHLEITEQSMIDYELLKRQILDLRDGGFALVLDDYGTGYSNLTRVKHYPFVNIKLDMEVVWDYVGERDSLLPTIVQGFRQMGLSITAEGIETEEMATLLTSIGSDYLQGYLFSRPLPTDEFAQRYGGAHV